MSFVTRLAERRTVRPDAVGVLEIEPMRRRHVRSVLEIETRVYPKPWTVGIFQGELDLVRSGERCYLVGRSGGETVAYGGLMLVGDEAHVTNIAVAPEHQRRGFGRRMLVELLRSAVRAGATAASLEVRVSNQAAQGLYRAMGFVPAGVRKRYYENTEDAIVMWCHDVHLPAFAARLDEMAAT